jgi:hypothetical protein
MESLTQREEQVLKLIVDGQGATFCVPGSKRRKRFAAKAGRFETMSNPLAGNCASGRANFSRQATTGPSKLSAPLRASPDWRMTWNSKCLIDPFVPKFGS